MAHSFLKYFPGGSFTKHVFRNFPTKPALLSQQPFLKVSKNNRFVYKCRPLCLSIRFPKRLRIKYNKKTITC